MKLSSYEARKKQAELLIGAGSALMVAALAKRAIGIAARKSYMVYCIFSRRLDVDSVRAKKFG